jgi:hypothetical protein
MLRSGALVFWRELFLAQSISPIDGPCLQW